MNAVISEIDAPVLKFSPRYDTLDFVRTKELLSVTNKLGLKKGVIIGNYIIDSSGKKYKTTGAKETGKYYPFWKFEFFNPMIYVELEVEKVKDEFDLEDLKKKVLKIVKREHGWVNYGEEDEIKRKIEGAGTHRELIEIIGNYIDPLPEK